MGQEANTLHEPSSHVNAWPLNAAPRHRQLQAVISTIVRVPFQQPFHFPSTLHPNLKFTSRKIYWSLQAVCRIYLQTKHSQQHAHPQRNR